MFSLDNTAEITRYLMMGRGTRKFHPAVKARRRKANKVARVNRRINRWKAKGKF